jgi:hypothetical protein
MKATPRKGTDALYAEYTGGPKILQDYRWSCLECSKDPSKVLHLFKVYESNRHGATTGMINHLRKHQITEASHNARKLGYSHGTGAYTENDTWSRGKKHQARLTAKEATRRWVVKTRQPFSVVDRKEFQEMFVAYGVHCKYKNRFTLRNHIYDDFLLRRATLRLELEVDCISISFTLDMWTAPNRTPIFAVIGHWWTADFQEREEVLEFIEVTGSHDGPALAKIVLELVEELKIKQKLFAICGDNAGNNGTLCESLFTTLKRTYDDKPSAIGKPRMQFHGRHSWIRCFAHVIALICTDILSFMKSGTAKEAKKLLDSWDKEYKCNTYYIPLDSSRSSIAKVRLFNLWILRRPEREQEWCSMPRTANRRPIYDVDTRWNSAYDMILQFLDLLPEYSAYIETHATIKCLLPTDLEIVALRQLAFVLKPFKDMTLKVSQDQPSLARSLEGYWDLDDLLTRVSAGTDIYADLDKSLRDAFKAGQTKYVKYSRKLDDNSMIYAAHILDPRCRFTMIKSMMPNADEVLKNTKEYFIREFPALALQDAPILLGTTQTSAEGRPSGMSLAQWNLVQSRRAEQVADLITQATSELERWMETVALVWDKHNNNSETFLVSWWKANALEWPLLAVAARHLLPCCGSEVDVERLFSGCRDEYGIRRHALKAGTVRVLTLLRSQYQSEDEVDAELIKEAMESDIVDGIRNSVLWRPDRFDGQIAGKLSGLILFLYLILTKIHNRS